MLKNKKFWLGAVLLSALSAAPAVSPLTFDLNQVTGTVQFSQNITLLLSLALISLLPFFLMTTTSFLRIVIVLGFVRSAIGTQQTPPSAVIVSVALFLTMYVMTPVWQEINSSAIQPYNNGVISQQRAFENGLLPLKNFMLRQTREKDLVLFIEFSKIPPITDIKDVPVYVLIPAFILSELTTAFKIAFVIFAPFIVVDMVVSNVLLSLGMFMLSPVMISLPFKILLFVLADGWFLITRGLVQSFT
ncbi:flagellar biosynthetic protein FliP [Candidatus Termititenax aidoneus]|uniref:Flagellar biosynthetic protein FliP n=1 Tax=Termititenax aidoneus TaxID=2218524 RepID=A0A388T8T7_TERA1|nr:flagellar biosynthetic protein FliP [Candidatus Termititenax aidoneus]